MPNVLVVEDERATRDGLAKLLENSGCTTATAGDAAAALQALDEHSFDLMLLDVWLPGTSGLQLLGELRKRPARPKVVMMTGDDTPETLLATLRGAADQFIRKPIQPAALIEMVKSTLASPATLPSIVVLSARPAWVELLVPCALEVADRIQGFITHLETELAADVRETMGKIFRELLLDAMAWDGQLDSNRKVRLAYLHARRMLMYRIADARGGFRAGDSPQSVKRQSRDVPRADNTSIGATLMRPGMSLARAWADELLINEARDEIVFVKYLE
jgi:DNA-binding response OmpR family regulator